MRLQTLFIFTSLMMMTLTAQAKDPYNAINDLTTGRKILKVDMASPTASKPAKSNKLSIKGLDVSAVKKTKTAGIRPKLVEFMYHGASELWLVDNKGTTAVRGGNLGSGQFSWEDSEGRLWVIPNYPWDNNHKPVSGMIISEGDMVVGKFTLLSIKSKGPQHTGRWVGELAFPGGARLPISAQAAGTRTQISGCKGGGYPLRIEIPGAPYLDSELLRCKGNFQHGTYYAQFLHWDSVNNSLWMFSINGDVWYNGTVFQGSAAVIPILGQGSYTEGKFYMTRPEGFSL